MFIIRFPPSEIPELFFIDEENDDDVIDIDDMWKTLEYFYFRKHNFS